jgi:hypothetical protein
MKNEETFSRIIIKDGYWSWFSGYHHKKRNSILWCDDYNHITKKFNEDIGYGISCDAILDLHWRRV